MGAYKRLDFEKRKRIAALYGRGLPVAEIGQQVNVNRSTVYNELRNGYTGTIDENGRPGYNPEIGQRRAVGQRWKVAASE